MSNDQRDLLYLFEKASDPLSVVRGHGQAAYDDGSGVASRFGANVNVIPVQPISNVDGSISNALQLPRGSCFSMFTRSHQRAAKEVIDLFMKAQNAQQLKNVAATVRDKMNETLFIYSLSVAILRNPALRHIRLPAIYEVFPYHFIPMEKIREAQGAQIRGDTRRIEWGFDFTGTDLNPEHRVAYWREDYGINSHHWHWHLVYPTNMGINRDRKGELFYYMHEQMLARYDMERLSLNMNRVAALKNFRDPIAVGYFSKLTVNNNGRPWGTRQDNTLMRDYNRRDLETFEPFTINQIELWTQRLYMAINQNRFINANGQAMRMTDDVDIAAGQKRGIDILGDMIEADLELSPNGQYYGDIHNSGHVIICFAHDPDGAHNEEPGPMADFGVSMRDPSFYELHKFIDNFYQEYKNSQRPYTEQELSLPNVRVERLNVATGREPSLFTGWTRREVEVSRGLDFGNVDRVIVTLTHLDHRAFIYHILVQNENNRDVPVTVRLFMAPKLNISGREMGYAEQKTLWTEMDKFTFNLKPGQNHIQRASTDSAVTIPADLTFRDIENAGADATANQNFCGCGWPQHMLLPRGKPEGMTFQLFCMLSDWTQDQVPNNQSGGATRCGNAASFCGILDQMYPDRRPMGFPFDRRNPPTLGGIAIQNASNMAAGLSNAMINDIVIYFIGDKLQG